MRQLKVDWFDLEMAFDTGEATLTGMRHYFDLQTGRVVSITGEERSILDEIDEEIGESRDPEQYRAAFAQRLKDWPIPDRQREMVELTEQVDAEFGTRYVSVPQRESGTGYRDMEDFIETVQDAELQARLGRAIQGRGAFRRFKDVLAADRVEQDRWYRLCDERLRQEILEWLESIGVEPTPDSLPPPRPPMKPVRSKLIEETLRFVQAACKLPGVTRIALIGSLATDKPFPKDTDLVVTVADDADLAPLAALGRKLSGHLQSALNLGADVFLADPAGRHLGRTCPWRDCGPGYRIRCDALHCGHRPYLHDDLNTIRLNKALIDHPPIVLWPKVVALVPVPQDVAEGLLRPLGC